MLVDAVVKRIEAEIAELAGRVHGAAQLAGLMQRNALPQITPAAFVLPLGLSPRGEGDAGAGAYIQMIDERVGVVLAIRAHGDATGHSALADLGQMIEAVIAAIAGWDPADEIGVFRLAGGRLSSLTAGTIVYELDFAIQRQVRIVT